MAYTASNLYMQSVAPGDAQYFYDAGSDSMATVAGSNYFDNGPDAAPALAAGDFVYCKCTDGNMWLKVSAVSATTGVATMQFAGGDLPVNSAAATASGALSMGYTEVNSGTASAFTLPTPYAGARVIVNYTGSASAGRSFVTDATTVTLNTQGDRTIVLEKEGEGFHLMGTSATRWRIMSLVMASNGLS